MDANRRFAPSNAGETVLKLGIKIDLLKNSLDREKKEKEALSAEVTQLRAELKMKNCEIEKMKRTAASNKEVFANQLKIAQASGEKARSDRDEAMSQLRQVENSANTLRRRLYINK